jgi:intermediate filament protein if
MSNSYSYEVEINRTVRPTIAPRSLVITRSQYGSGGGGGFGASSSFTRNTRTTPGALAILQSTGVSDLKSTRDKEKRDMQDLNERFASYIEKVRFLEAQNKRLADELDRLKSKWGVQTTQIKAMYEAELNEAKRLLEEAEKEKANLEKRVAALEEQLEELKNKLEEATKAVAEIRDSIEKQNQQLSDIEAEKNLLERRMFLLTGDRDKDKKEIARLQDALNRARIDLDNETLLHIDAENKRQALEDELEFLKQLHDQELKELAALAYRDTTSENREFWKNEMGDALRNISVKYEEKMDDLRNEMDTFYNMKMQEFRTGANRNMLDSVHSKEETTRLRTQLDDLRGKLGDLENKNSALQRELDNLRREKEERERELEDENNKLRGNVAAMRAELEAIKKELEDLQDAKLSLELEIAAYRKLLDGEENRSGLRQVVDSLYNSMNAASNASPDEYSAVKQVIRGEMSAKTTNQRSAKGPTAIGECAVDGKFVCIENTGRKNENIGGWTVQRVVDGEVVGEMTLPGDLELKPGDKLKLHASGTLPSGANPKTDIEAPVKNWGSGTVTTTKIMNPAGEDRATLIQKTVA